MIQENHMPVRKAKRKSAKVKVKQPVVPPVNPWLARCVDASLSTNSWLRIAKWLSFSPLRCFPAPMRYGSKTCASKALCIYIGKKVETLRGMPTLDMVIETAKQNGAPMELLYHAEELPERCLMFGTIPADEGGSHGDKGALIAVKHNGSGDLNTVRAHMQSLMDGGVKKMTLTVFNQTLYPDGHCIVLKKVKNTWLLSDPLMPPASCLIMPSEEALVLLMCGARTIVGV
jgi:hypothetical protein